MCTLVHKHTPLNKQMINNFNVKSGKHDFTYVQTRAGPELHNLYFYLCFVFPDNGRHNIQTVNMKMQSMEEWFSTFLNAVAL